MQQRRTAPSLQSQPPPSMPKKRQESPPPEKIAPPIEKDSKRIKLTIEGKKPTFNRNNNVVLEKLDDFEEEIWEDEKQEQEDVATPTAVSPPSPSPSPPSAQQLSAAGITTSTTKTRREELMKQLRAVEEAIAKKRSKIE